MSLQDEGETGGEKSRKRRSASQVSDGPPPSPRQGGECPRLTRTRRTIWTRRSTSQVSDEPAAETPTGRRVSWGISGRGERIRTRRLEAQTQEHSKQEFRSPHRSDLSSRSTSGQHSKGVDRTLETQKDAGRKQDGSKLKLAQHPHRDAPLQDGTSLPPLETPREGPQTHKGDRVGPDANACP